MTTNTKTTVKKINLDSYSTDELYEYKRAIETEIDKRNRMEHDEDIKKLLALISELDDKYGLEEAFYVEYIDDKSISWSDLYKAIRDGNF